jgi:hypothetical protein
MTTPEEKPPSTDLQVMDCVRIVLYLAAVVIIGSSFSWSLDLLNDNFAAGAAGTIVNVCLSLLLIHHVVTRHEVLRKFFNQG